MPGRDRTECGLPRVSRAVGRTGLLAICLYYTGKLHSEGDSLLIFRPGRALSGELILQAPRDQRRPAGLMAGAAAASGVRMKVFIEVQQPAPVGIARVDLVVALPRRPPARIR